MSVRELSLAFAAAGQLALGLLALARGRPSPLALPLGLSALSMFGWAMATLGYRSARAPIWNGLDLLLSALSPVFVLHFVLVFVGRVRAERALLLLGYAAFSGLALFGFFVGYGARGLGTTWSALFLALWLPSFGYELFLLIRHLGAADSFEQARTRLILVALVLGALTMSTDVINDFGVPLPSLGGLGGLATSGLAMAAALRFGLFGKSLDTPTSVYAVLVAACAVIALIVLVAIGGESLPLVAFGAAIVTLSSVLLVKESLGALAAHRARTRDFAALGRVTAQLAHDLKNPLAALLGATQVLERATEAAERDRFVALVRQQAERIRATIDDYERLARVEPLVSRVRLNELVESSVRPLIAARGPSERAPELRCELEPDLPEQELDPDLIAASLENLVRNALEAMPHGGAITVRTALLERARERCAALSVSDTGPGMDARTRERAFDEYFSTKPNGGGLGLAFVQRVMAAHGGEAEISVPAGGGTRVTLYFPLK